MLSLTEIFGTEPDLQQRPLVAYLSMEYAIDQCLKIYSGGLGFLSGSHLRSARESGLPLIGIGILWKYGYYDQVRNTDDLMEVRFIEKHYSFLQDTNINFTVTVHSAPVHVKVWLLKPETLGSAPLFLLSTDIPENDELSRSITHNLYDSNEATRIAQSIVLGIGGGMLIDILNLTPGCYHLNEGHGVALCFYLYAKFKNLDEVRKKLVFTTHTPEAAGNESHDYHLLEEMSFFYHLMAEDVKQIFGVSANRFNYTECALKSAKVANGVSRLHTEVTKNLWSGERNAAPIISITNAQNRNFWTDDKLLKAFADDDDSALLNRKQELKKELFRIVADQCGKLFNEEVLTIVWARRLAGYKRANLILQDWCRFVDLISQTKYPVQVIFAGKPYPEDEGAIGEFNQLISRLSAYNNCAVLTGYELALSSTLKKGADVWLNTPRMYHEASGTSGMSAAMNGAVNLSTPDGWVPEFARDGENCFVIEPASNPMSDMEQDHIENIHLMDKLEQAILPLYYNARSSWLKIMKTASADIAAFESARMVKEYEKQMYIS